MAVLTGLTSAVWERVPGGAWRIAFFSLGLLVSFSAYFLAAKILQHILYER
jgi:hypothetical protein